MTVTFESDSKLDIIGSACFAGTSVASLSFPASLSDLSIDALSKCECLQTVVFPPDSKLSKIGGLGELPNLITPIDIPASVEVICRQSFRRCGIPSVAFPPNSALRLIATRAFASSCLEEICIPGSVERIKDGAFSACQRLRKVEFVFESHLVHLGREAFADCIALTTIAIPSSAKSVDNRVLADGAKLAECDF
jgi:hypothetical protein